MNNSVFYQPMTSLEDADVALVGLPFDGTVSGRAGARSGPAAIRAATLGMEDYSPYRDLDIGDLRIHDAGDLELPYGDTARCIDTIREECRPLVNADARLISLGGEHLVSWPLVQLMHERYGDSLFVIQFDAHADLREDYLGVRLSHASAMRLIVDTVGYENTAVLGIRSGTKDEWNILRTQSNLFGGAVGPLLSDFMPFAARELEGCNVYITLDLDVFDPGIMPGTGTPEAGGISFQDFNNVLGFLDGVHLVGADIVELAPDYDHSGVSSFLAATVLRELMLMMRRRK